VIAEDKEGTLFVEADENAQREDLPPSEQVALGLELAPVLLEQAKRAKEEGGESPSARGKSRDRIGAMLGIDGTTWTKMRRVVEAAKEDPQAFGDLVTQMDETRRGSSAFERAGLRRRGARERPRRAG
jgi:hypothetical protein